MPLSRLRPPSRVRGRRPKHRTVRQVQLVLDVVLAGPGARAEPHAPALPLTEGAVLLAVSWWVWVPAHLSASYHARGWPSSDRRTRFTRPVPGVVRRVGEVGIPVLGVVPEPVEHLSDRLVECRRLGGNSQPRNEHHAGAVLVDDSSTGRHRYREKLTHLPRRHDRGHVLATGPSDQTASARGIQDRLQVRARHGEAVARGHAQSR